MLALNVNNLEKTYDNGTRALNGVSLQVEEGDFFALLGPNGAGKSTLIGIVSSLVNSTAGDVEIFGLSVERQRAAAMCQLGLVPQEMNFNWFERPLEIVVNQAGYYGIPRSVAVPRAEELLHRLELYDKRDVISRTLSGGMKRRLMIARAMVHQPRLLILDEPTAGVDIEIRRAMWEYIQQINEQGTTVILTTHYLEEAEELCRNIAIIDHGEIVENTSVRELLTRLDMETFVLDLDANPETAPVLDGYDVRLRPDGSIEVDVSKSRALNRVFALLDDAGHRVMSMRNKSNRLEELFLRLVEKKSDD
ncbi:MAG: ABC transporter ATP-binding protein [Pseudomonadota bacterium]